MYALAWDRSPVREPVAQGEGCACAPSHCHHALLRLSKPIYEICYGNVEHVNNGAPNIVTLVISRSSMTFFQATVNDRPCSIALFGKC